MRSQCGDVVLLAYFPFLDDVQNELLVCEDQACLQKVKLQQQQRQRP
jgi:hypothetical protein